MVKMWSAAPRTPSLLLCRSRKYPQPMIYQSGAPSAFLASAEMMLAPMRRSQSRLGCEVH